MATKQRLHYVDVSNCVAILFVLILHSAQLTHFGTGRSPQFMLTAVLQLVCIPAVYIFFMNSGATLLDYRKRQSTDVFARRRLSRVGVPFLFWTVVYYLYDIRHSAFPGPIRHSNPGIHDFINAFTNNGINNTFWFFYAIIALYLVTPIFSLLTEKHRKLILGAVIGYFMINDVLPYLGNLTGLSLVSNYVSQPLLSSSFLGYFLMGYLIRIRYFSRQVENWLIVTGIGLQLLVICNLVGKWNFRFLNGMGVFLYSVAVYLLIMRVTAKWTNQRWLSGWAVLSGASLGVYILHPFFYEAFDKLIFHIGAGEWHDYYLKVLSNPIHIYGMPFVAYALLVPLVLLCKKSHIIRRVLP